MKTSDNVSVFTLLDVLLFQTQQQLEYFILFKS